MQVWLKGGFSIPLVYFTLLNDFLGTVLAVGVGLEDYSLLLHCFQRLQLTNTWHVDKACNFIILIYWRKDEEGKNILCWKRLGFGLDNSVSFK